MRNPITTLTGIPILTSPWMSRTAPMRFAIVEHPVLAEHGEYVHRGINPRIVTPYTAEELKRMDENGHLQDMLRNHGPDWWEVREADAQRQRWFQWRRRRAWRRRRG